jgi:isopenicillin N synthase-like dioxygenase
MQVMNNGIFKSPMHRVLADATKERFSVVIFYGVDGETMIEPAPGLLDENRPARYGRVKGKDYHASVFRHFRQGESIKDTLKF